MNSWPAAERNRFLIELKTNRTTGPMLFQRSFYSCVFALCLVVSGCSKSSQSSDHSTASSAQHLPTPVEAASLARNPDQKLSQVLDGLLQSQAFANGRWGVAVLSLADGKLIYEHNGERLFTPASNMKIYTTAVALDLLGADYRWRTSVYSDNGPDADGTIRGDVVLYGRGSPDLVSSNRNQNTNSIEELVKALVARGVKRIEGNIVGDESYFRGSPTGQGWQWNDLQWYFGAEAGALTINSNSFEVSIQAASKTSDQPKVTTNDLDGYVQVVNNLATVPTSEPLKLGVHRGLSDNNVVVWGQYPINARGYGVALAVHRPSLWAALMFLRTLKAQGITVSGSAQFRDSRTAEKLRFDPASKHELAHVTGKPLSEIVKTTNKQSNNLFAELLLRTLGRERTPTPPQVDKASRELGDDEKGAQLVEVWLRSKGIKISGLAIHDGSGLSRLNLVSPVMTTQLLAEARKTNSAELFTDSLPVAGVDGTLQGRLQPLEGKILAKTGALSYDNSLSGYFFGANGQVYAFSVICNDMLAQRNSIGLIDQLVLAMADHLGIPSQTSKP